MIADLDTLLIALYVELTDRIIPSLALYPVFSGRVVGRRRPTPSRSALAGGVGPAAL